MQNFLEKLLKKIKRNKTLCKWSSRSIGGSLTKLKKEVSKYQNDERSEEEEVVIMKKPKKKIVYVEKPVQQQLPAPPTKKSIAYM